MASLTQSHYIVPIGCSCINQFQLNFKFGQSSYDSQLFDWNIITPHSTIEIFKSKGLTFVNSLNDLSLHSECILKSERLPGFYWWHMNQFVQGNIHYSSIKDFEPYFDSFKNKHQHQVEKFFRMNPNNITFLWSNLQPNLKSACQSFFDQFTLTSSRYHMMKDAIAESFKGAKTIFLVRPELVETDILVNDDVMKFDLPYSEEFKGDENLFSSVWDRYNLGK